MILARKNAPTNVGGYRARHFQTRSKITIKTERTALTQRQWRALGNVVFHCQKDFLKDPPNPAVFLGMNPVIIAASRQSAANLHRASRTRSRITPPSPPMGERAGVRLFPLPNCGVHEGSPCSRIDVSSGAIFGRNSVRRSAGRRHGQGTINP